jgi:ion channel-forming bestrophin family protein
MHLRSMHAASPAIESLSSWPCTAHPWLCAPTTCGMQVRQRLWAEDPGLNQALISSGTTISQLFNQDKWKIHRSSSRYLVHLLRIPTSTVFRRVLMPCCVLTAVAIAVCTYNAQAPAHWARLAISTVPHMLLGAAISLQLVFRTNGSYSR